jgi:hypothetical protein
MTTKELIAELTKLPPDMPVTHSRDDFQFDIREVEVIKATRYADDHYSACYFPEVEEETLYDIAVIRG